VGIGCLRLAGYLIAALLPLQPAPAGAESVDTILTQLEQRSNGLKDIRCRVKFVEDDRVNLSTLTKTGRLQLMIGDPNAVFLVHFERTEVDGVVGKQEWYLFDGQWLYQALERLQQVTKQEVARAGEKLDLFDLETAPFPLPFGQKKDKILRHFEVTLAAPAPGDPPDSHHLVCIPRADSRMARKYDRLDFFVRRGLNLPVKIVVSKNDGQEVNTADFPDLTEKSINSGVSKDDFARPAAWAKYSEVVEELVPLDEPPR
jgi:hypothetical protein